MKEAKFIGKDGEMAVYEIENEVPEEWKKYKAEKIIRKDEKQKNEKSN